MKAQVDFAAEQDNQVFFQVGVIMEIPKDDPGDGWIEARLDGKVGAIPATFVEGIV